MRYTSLNNDLWLDNEVSKLNSNEKLFYLYLLSCPLGNAAGYYRLPLSYISIATAISEKETIRIAESDSTLWKYDKDSSQVFIKGFLKHNPMKTTKQIAGLNTQLSALECCPLHIDFMFDVQKYVGAEACLTFSENIKRYIRVKANENPTGLKESVLLTIYKQ